MSQVRIKVANLGFFQLLALFIAGSSLALIALFVTFGGSELFSNSKTVEILKSVGNSSIIGSIMNVIKVVGWTFWPLLVMAIYLTIISMKNISSKYHGEVLSPIFLKHLEILAWVAMMVGLMGTVSALIQALQNTDLSLSIDETIARLNISLGKALYSTLIGVAISVLAQIQVSLKHETEDEKIK